LPAEATAERFDNTLHKPPADLADAPPADAEQGSLARPVPLVAALPDKRAPSGLAEDRPSLSEPLSSSILRAPDFVEEETAAACDQLGQLLIAETSASNPAVAALTADIAEANRRAAQISAPPPLDISAETPGTARAAAHDPLAALNALSEEEIIALFS
jgi:hypothetical protein